MISPQTFFKLLAAASLLRTANSDVDSAAAAAAAAEATLYSRLRHINASCTPQSSSSSSSSSFYSRVERLALEALLSDDAPDLRRLRSLPAVAAAVPTEYHNRGLALVMLHTLQASERWENRYRGAALSEHMVGAAALALVGDRLPRASLKSVQTAYFVALFESLTRYNLDDPGLIVEFGGGFGSMAYTLLRGLGNFRGTYVLFDLPVASALQEYVLTLAGVVVGAENPLPESQPFRVLCVSAVEDLKASIDAHGNGSGGSSDGSAREEEQQRHSGAESIKTFIGLWSFSEAPLPLRGAVIKLLRGFDRFFVGYQPLFGGAGGHGGGGRGGGGGGVEEGMMTTMIDNEEYFQRSFKAAVEAQDEDLRHGHSTLIWTDLLLHGHAVLEASGSRVLAAVRAPALALPHSPAPPAVASHSVVVRCDGGRGGSGGGNGGDDDDDGDGDGDGDGDDGHNSGDPRPPRHSTTTMMSTAAEEDVERYLREHAGAFRSMDHDRVRDTIVGAGRRLCGDRDGVSNGGGSGSGGGGGGEVPATVAVTFVTQPQGD
jgi:hypothetical protein